MDDSSWLCFKTRTASKWKKTNLCLKINAELTTTHDFAIE
jgi:hypothetical protein